MIRVTHITINSSVYLLHAALDAEMNKMDKTPCPCGAYIFMRKTLSKIITLIVALNATKK